MIINVIICTYDRYDLLDQAVASVIGQDLPVSEYQITVIDNSPDASRSREMSSRWRDTQNLLWHHEPVAGLSRARNLGLELTTTPFVAFLDDDAIASESWLSRKIEAFAYLGPSTHVIGGRVRLRFQGARPAWLADNMLCYLSECDLGEETRLIRPDEWVVGANLSYRTAAVKEAGGFSVALGRVGSGASLMSNDETDLQERINARGGLAGYSPAAEVDHLVLSARLRQGWFRKRMAWQAVSDYVRAPDVSQLGAAAAWDRAKAFLASCAPADRTLRGLALAHTDQQRFAAQMGATYDAVQAILAGLHEDDAG